MISVSSHSALQHGKAGKCVPDPYVALHTLRTTQLEAFMLKSEPTPPPLPSLPTTLPLALLIRYISTVKQANASAAAAGVNCGMFMLAGVLILVGAYAVQAMGVGPFFTLLAGVQLLMSLTSAACITWGFVSVRRQQAAAEQLPVRA